MKHILVTLTFYVKYPGWNSYSKTDRSTKNAIKSLVKRGYLKTNEFQQAIYTGKIW